MHVCLLNEALRIVCRLHKRSLRIPMQVTQTSTAVRGLPIWLDMFFCMEVHKYTGANAALPSRQVRLAVFPAVPYGKQGLGNLHVSEARDPLSSQNVAKRTKHLFRQMETFMSRPFGSAVCFTLGIPRLLLFAHGRCDLSNFRHIVDELYRTGYSG